MFAQSLFKHEGAFVVNVLLVSACQFKIMIFRFERLTFQVASVEKIGAERVNLYIIIQSVKGADLQWLLTKVPTRQVLGPP
jgi:hypothetical protein